MFWVYMLQCADNSFYVGHTDNLESRVSQHRAGNIPTCYTFSRRPVTLVFSQDFDSRDAAFSMERRIKGWSRAKKRALVNNDWDEISRLAKPKYGPNPSTP
jgi:putative endonuclease